MDDISILRLIIDGQAQVSCSSRCDHCCTHYVLLRAAVSAKSIICSCPCSSIQVNCSADTLAPPSVGRRPGQSLQQVGWEPVPQLAGVRRQVDAHLLQLHLQVLGRALVAAELPAAQPLPLPSAAHHRPHQQVAHVGRYHLRQACELRRVGSDRRRVAVRRQGQDLKRLNLLLFIATMLDPLSLSQSLLLTSRAM